MRQSNASLTIARLTQTAFCTLATIAVSVAYAAPDPAKGQQLHDKQCVECHMGAVGSDASKIYTRPNHIIKSRSALSQRVTFCATQINAGWFPEDEENVAAYLNDKYYKFK
jgi:mono/diheme cytochrome c family protein